MANELPFKVNKLDVVFFQRRSDNLVYEQVNISGSSAIFCLDDRGILTADRFSNQQRSEGTTGRSLQSYDRNYLFFGETVYGVDTMTVGHPNRLMKYYGVPNGTYGVKTVETETHTIDTPSGIAIGKTDEEPYVNATLDVSGTVIITGSLTVSGFIYGSASYALTASYVSGSTGLAETASYALNAGSASYALTASYISSSIITNVPFNGNRSIKRTPYVGLNVGGTTITEFTENFFFPFVPSTITINTATLNYETGSKQNISLSGTITVNDETFFDSGSIKEINFNRIVHTFLAPPYSYSTTDVDVSKSSVYRTFFRVGNNGTPTNIQSSTKTVNFNWPYLYNISTVAGLTGTSLYGSMQKDSSKTSAVNSSYSFIGVSVYIYFAYPSSYGTLYSIKDPNLFDVTSAFSTYTTVVTSIGYSPNWTETYRVYQLTLKANPTGMFLFNFTPP